VRMVQTGLAASLVSLVLLAPGAASAASGSASPTVWIIDDGEKIRADDVSTPLARGVNNPVWRPGEPARLFAMRNESVALQVVVETGDAELEGVTVELPELD
jgi:hypothetical protein